MPEKMLMEIYQKCLKKYLDLLLTESLNETPRRAIRNC